MADKITLKAIPASGDATALQELETGDTQGVAHGGTGSTTASGARTNLGLGTAAVEDIGTSGATVPLNSTANVFSSIQDFSAAGIHLGTAAAANLLDDYEKGTWDVVVADAATGGNEATATILGTHIKIGDAAILSFDVQNIDTTGLTGTNTLFIRNLPFVSASSGPRSEGNVYLARYTASANTINLTPTISLSDTWLTIRETSSADAVAPSVTVSQLTSGVADIFGTIVYFTD